MSGYDALAAKVRAMYGKRLRMSDFEHISTLRSEAEVLEYLRTQPGWKRALSQLQESFVDRARLETALKDEIREEYVALSHFIPRKDQFLLAFPVMLVELDELLAALRRLAAHGRVKPAAAIPPRFLLHGKLDVQALARCGDYDGLVEAARRTIYEKPLRRLRPEQPGALPDYTAAEVLLRSTYYAALYQRIHKAYTGPEQKVLLQSVGMQVDLLNITHILRLKRYFPGDSRYFSALFPFNYRLKPDMIQALCAAEDDEAVFALLADSPYARVFADRDVHSLEDYFQRTFAAFNHHQLTAGTPSVYTAIAYLHLKELEMRALINDIECVKYGEPFDPYLARLAGA